MPIYSVTWKDENGAEHSQCFAATSASAAMALALERVDELARHPNRITRVLLETKPS